MSKSKNGALKTKLTIKQIRFAECFAICLHGTKSAILAGYPRASAAQVAYENLRKPHIVQAVRDTIATLNQELNLDRDAIIAELLTMAFARHTLLSRHLDRGNCVLPGITTKKFGRVEETRVKNYALRLETISRTWSRLSYDQIPTLNGRANVERIIRNIHQADA